MNTRSHDQDLDGMIRISMNTETEELPILGRRGFCQSMASLVRIFLGYHGYHQETERKSRIGDLQSPRFDDDFLGTNPKNGLRLSSLEMFGFLSCSTY